MMRRNSLRMWSLFLVALLPVSLGVLCQPTAPQEDPTDNEPGQPVPTVLDAVATVAPSPAGGGQIVILDASGSVGPAGATLTFAWAQTGGSPNVTLTNASSAQSGFIAPNLTAEAVLSFTVTVGDGTTTDTASVDVTITKTNRSPVAAAGVDKAAQVGSPVSLDGTNSNDPDGDAITYAWTQTAGPSATLQGADSVQPNFVAPSTADGATLTFELTVSDGTLTDTDTVNVVLWAEKAPVAPVGNDNVLGLIPDDIDWLLSLRNIQGLFSAVDGIIEDPGRVEALIQDLMDKLGMGDVNLPDLNGAFAAFQLKPEATPVAIPQGTDGFGPPPPCLLFQLTMPEIEDFLLQVMKSQIKETIEVQETALGDPFAGVTQIDFVVLSLPPEGDAEPTIIEEGPKIILTLFAAPLGGGDFTVLTAGSVAVTDFASVFPGNGSARAIKRVIDWQGQYIEERFDDKWVSTFEAGHALAWAEGDFIYEALGYILGGLLNVLPSDDKITSAGEGMAKLMGSLPMAVTMPTEIVEGNPFDLDDVCLVIKVAEPGVGSLWVRFYENSVPAQYLDALPNTSESMLLGLPDEPIFGAFGMIGPWVGQVLDAIDWDNDNEPAAVAMAGAKPLLELVQDATDGQTLMMAGTISELRPEVIVRGATPSGDGIGCGGPRVGGALVVTGPGVGDPEGEGDVINRILDEIYNEEPDWIDYETETGEFVGEEEVVWLLIDSYELTNGDGVPHPIDVIWDYLPECRRFEVFSGFGWDILVRVVRADANHVAFSIDSLGVDHAMARLEGMVADILAGNAPLADRPVIKNAAATLATSRTAVAYLAAWPNPDAPGCIFNTGQFLKFEYDLEMFNLDVPVLNSEVPLTDPGDATKAMAISFGSYGGRIAELYVSIPIEDLLKAALLPPPSVAP